MAEAVPETNGANNANRSTSLVPIAQLSPNAIAPASVKAVVTLIWPYSSATGSAALLLAEPDFRLRREKGQVRVRFSGSSGKAIAGSGIGSGDVVTLSLEGVEWVKEESTTRQLGRGIEWELRYTERVLLEVLQEETQNISVIDINHPAPAEEPLAPEEPVIEPIIAAPELTGPPTPFNRSRKISDLEAEYPEEWQSPAFIKRARTSYGSLFGSSDIFAQAEDGSIKGKDRRRSKLGWRYTSRSPSPTPSDDGDQGPANEVSGDASLQTPAMTDEGCQTNGIGDALVETAESLAEPVFAASNTFAEPSRAAAAEANVTSDYLMSQMHSQQPSLQNPSQDWTTLNIQPPNREANFGAINSSLESQLISTSTASYILSRTEENLFGLNSAGSQVDHDGLPDGQAGFGDDLQSPSMAGFEFSDQYGNWQSAMAANDPLSRPSPRRPSNPPSPTKDGMLDSGQKQTEPYYENADLSVFPSNDANAGDMVHSMAPPGVDSTRSRKPSTSEDRSHHSSARQTPTLQLPQGSVSRSQSAPREVMDLTGSSDEEGDDADDEDDLVEDVFVDEEASDGLWNDNNEAQYEEDYEIEYEEHYEVDDFGNRVSSRPDQYPPGILGEQNYDDEEEYDSDLRRTDYESREEDDEEDEEDEEDDEDEDNRHDLYDRYDRVPGANAAPKGEPAVISLLSSDEEDGDNEDPPAPQSSTFDRKPLERLLSGSVKDEYSSGSGEDATDSGEEDGQDGVDGAQEAENHELREASRLSAPGEDDLQVEEVSNRPSPSRRRYAEHTSIDARERRPSLASYDGAADVVDEERVLESVKVELLPPARATVGEDENTASQSDKTQYIGAAEPETPLPEEFVSNTEANADNEPDLSMSEVAPMPMEHSPVQAVKAQILEILTNEEPITAQSTPAADNLDLGELEGEESIAEDMEIVNETEITVNETEITVAAKEISSQELPETLNNTEMTETPLYPELPPNDGDAEDETSTKEDASTLRVGSLKNEQLPTPDDTQMTGLASSISSFEATQSSGNQTQLTDTTSNTASFEATKLGEASISVVVNATETASTLLVAEERQSQEGEDDLNGGHTEREETTPKKSQSGPSEAKKAEMTVETHLIPEEPQPLPVTPRRSQRQAGKALNSPKPLVTPQKASPIAEEPISPDGYDASAELALDSANSPSKRDLRDSNQPSKSSTLTSQLKRSLRTDRGEYTILKDLRIKQNRKPDILAIATTPSSNPQQAKKPPKDWYTDFNITDASVGPGVVTRVAVFRPNLHALPLVSPGDGLLLRNFKVQTEKGMKFSLRSEGDSSWAVIKADGSVEKRGPPVEDGEEEFKYVASLKEWFEAMPAAQREVLQKAHFKKAEKGKGV